MFTPNSPDVKSDVVGTLAAVLERFGFIMLAIWLSLSCYIAGLIKLECAAVNSNAIKC
jgi:hypothetical protein